MFQPPKAADRRDPQAGGQGPSALCEETSAPLRGNVGSQQQLRDGGLTKKITELLQLDFPQESFTSAILVKNTCMPTHKDLYNDEDSRNLVSPLKVTEGAGVWEEMKPGDVFKGRLRGDAGQGNLVPKENPSGELRKLPEEVPGRSELQWWCGSGRGPADDCGRFKATMVHHQWRRHQRLSESPRSKWSSLGHQSPFSVGAGRFV